MHIDMNSYFASVEQQANPFLRGKPIGVTGKRAAKGQKERSVITTASIEAKALGVKTAMSTWEAQRILPELILVPGDPHKYSELTHRFNAIYREFTDKVERFSVDECFLDITDTAKDYMGATIMAQMIRERLKEECGERVTASIGIAANRLMAKMASESVKPNGLTVVKPQDAITFLDTRELQAACGIGPRIAARLDAMGITSFQELRKIPIALLVDEFKSYGYWLHEASYGRDSSPLVLDDEDPKSVGHSYTLPEDTTSSKEMRRYLLGLCDRVAWRMRRDGFIARRVTAYVRYGDFGGCGKQKQFKEPTADGLTLFKIAWSLIEGTRDPAKSIRLLGISASDLSKGPEQQPLFKKDRKMRSVLPALDTVQYRYGQGSWTRASLLKTEIKERTSGYHYDHEV